MIELIITLNNEIKLGDLNKMKKEITEIFKGCVLYSKIEVGTKQSYFIFSMNNFDLDKDDLIKISKYNYNLHVRGVINE